VHLETLSSDSHFLAVAANLSLPDRFFLPWNNRLRKELLFGRQSVKRKHEEEETYIRSVIDKGRFSRGIFYFITKIIYLCRIQQNLMG
jgi:hypothetical protein